MYTCRGLSTDPDDYPTGYGVRLPAVRKTKFLPVKTQKMAEYKLVEGYDEALDLICRMRKCTRADIYKCESIIRYADIYGERFFEKGPNNRLYSEIVFLTMANEYGYHPDTDRVRKKAYEDVRTGRFAVRPR